MQVKASKPGNASSTTSTTTTKASRRRRGRSLSQYGFHSAVNDRRNNQASPAPAAPAQAPAASSSSQQPWTQRLSIEIAPNSTVQAKQVRDALLGGKLVATRVDENNGTVFDSPLVAALSDAGWDEVEDAAISSVDGKVVAGSSAAAATAAAAAAAQNTKSLSGGAVAGIVIAVLLLALALAALGAFVMARRRGKGKGGEGLASAADPKKENKGRTVASWLASLGGGGAAQNGNAAAFAADDADAPTKLASSRSTDLEVAAAKAAALALAAPSSRHSSTTDLASHKLDIEAVMTTSPAVQDRGAGGRRFRNLFGGGSGAAASTSTTAATATKEASTPPALPQPNYEPAEPGLGTEQVVAGARRDLASIAAAGVSSLRKLAASAAAGGGGGGGGGGGAASAAAVAGSPHKQQQHQPPPPSSSSKAAAAPADDPVSQAEASIAALAARGTPYAGKYALSRQGPLACRSNNTSRSRPTTIVYRATELAPPGRAATATFYLSDEQFRHEASLAARLPPGDVTPEVLDAYAAGDAPGARALPACVVAEAADYSLEDWPERRARAPDAVQRRAVLALVGKAVAGALARGVVHGSLCPSAVLWFSGANAMRLGELSRWAPAGGRAPLHAEPR